METFFKTIKKVGLSYFQAFYFPNTQGYATAKLHDRIMIYN